jgi:uncharacterized lipoprotein YajG
MRYIVLITALFTLGSCSTGSQLISYPFPVPGEKIEGETKTSKKISVELFTNNAKPMLHSAYIIKDLSNIIGVYSKDKNEVIIQSDNKIDELLQQVLVAEFNHAGLTVVEGGGDVALAGQINSFSASVVQTKDDYLLANVQVYLKVLSPKTDKILYEGHYLAGSMLEVSYPPYNSDFIEVLESGLLRLINKIMNDKALLSALAG